VCQGGGIVEHADFRTGANVGAQMWALAVVMYRFGLVAMYALALCLPHAAGADILDSETWDNHVEQITELSNANQYRRTMNRGFDAMSAIGGGPSAANEMAGWKAALVVPSSSQHELNVFLAKAKVSSEDDRRALRTYMLQRFAAYPAEARQASPALEPRNVVDARIFALQTAYRLVRPESPTSGAATLLLSVALSRQMTQAFNAHHYTAQQKQDAHDYYVIIRAFIEPAVERIPEAGPIDANTRRSLTAFARAFLVKDTAIDPAIVPWDQLPCVGISAVECQVQTAIARSALSH
jgi:hypothetical protein